MSDAAEISFRHVTKRYRGRSSAALTDFSLTVPAGQICVLVGPSGGGKTTALKMVNRLIEPDSGSVHLDGRDVRELDPIELRRRIGYVIQQVGLFPHLRVGENVAVVPKLLGWPKERIRARVDELLERVELGAAERERYPAELSGGQRQRVGLARAMAADPQVMLMDEPFGALDPPTRARLQDQLLELQRELRRTVIFVTHDVDEAVKLGDTVAILRGGGVLVQHDTPDAVLARPADAEVARFVGLDRGLKRLSLLRIADVQLEPHADEALALPRETTLRDALSLLLAEGATSCAVHGGDGSALGSLSLERIAAVLAGRDAVA